MLSWGGEEGLIKGMSLQRFRSCCRICSNKIPYLLLTWIRTWTVGNGIGIDGFKAWDKDGQWLVLDGTKVRSKMSTPVELVAGSCPHEPGTYSVSTHQYCLCSSRRSFFYLSGLTPTRSTGPQTAFGKKTNPHPSRACVRSAALWSSLGVSSCAKRMPCRSSVQSIQQCTTRATHRMVWRTRRNSSTAGEICTPV